jgi:hypothetical protein
MANRREAPRDGNGRIIRESKPEPKTSCSPKREPKTPTYVDGAIVHDVDDVRGHRVQSRKDFTDAIQSKGGEGRTYGAATNKLYGKVFRDGTPMGKPDQWSAENQKRVTVAQKVAKQYIDDGDDGHYGIISSVERGGSDANGRCNEDGVDPWWRKLVGFDNHEKAQLAESNKVVERAQTDADDEDDSHLTEGGRMLRASRKRAAEAEAKESAGGGFFRAVFGNGKTVWDEEQDSSSSTPAEPHEAGEESSGGFWAGVFGPKNYWDD